jgi:hypothetical protein
MIWEEFEGWWLHGGVGVVSYGRAQRKAEANSGVVCALSPSESKRKSGEQHLGVHEDLPNELGNVER